jgi:uncharacterized protein (DUF433 family)
MMPLEIVAADPPPLRTDAGGVVRVGRTRVSLDSLVYAFREGCSVEEIVLRYPALSLMDAYAAVTYYLHHRDAVDAYLEERHHKGETLRKRVEEQFPSNDLRERLLARKTEAK